jgi:hypothetical protein
MVGIMNLAQEAFVTSGIISRSTEKILLSPFLATKSSGFSVSCVTRFAKAMANSAGFSINACLAALRFRFGAVFSCSLFVSDSPTISFSSSI